MTTTEFVALVECNADRVHEYKLGHDGSDGLCDCIGLIIGAWRLGGNKWPWTHGSNYTARHLTKNLVKNGVYHLGDLVFKGRDPGENGYALPDRYQNDSDLTDYYHVGVVTNLTPFEITHCTSVPGGIKVDSRPGNWKYSGQFSKLEQEAYMEKEMIVQAENGKPVRLRNGPSTNNSVVCEIPVGEKVTVLTDKDGWAFVRHGDKQGYMMDKFLREPLPNDDGGVLYQHVKAIRALISEAKQKLDEAGDLLDKVQ